jgi:hypothetical protein
MARSQKKGLSFFSLQVDALLNKKVRLLQADSGERGVLVWLHILSYAYKENGYYFDMNNVEEVEHFASEVCKCSAQVFQSVVAVAVKRKLFVESVFRKHKVLTCEDMQDTFLQATAERRKKGTIVHIKKDYLLDDVLSNSYVSPEKILILHGNNESFHWNNNQNTGSGTQSRVEYSKEEKSKVKESKEQPANNNFFLKEENEETRHKAQGTSEQQPRSYSDVLTFFDSTLTKLSIDAGFISSSSQKFYNHYESKHWKVDGIPLEDWKARARLWMNDDLKKVKA